MKNRLKNELHNVLSGKSQVRYGAIIQAITCYLVEGEKTSPTAEVGKHFKNQETKRLENFISEKNLWIKEIDFHNMLVKVLSKKSF